MKKLFFYCVIATLISSAFLTGCKKDKEAENTVVKINGSVQKGPFLSGTSITIAELDQSYSQTGKTFSAEINDDLGSFEISNVALTSSYVSVRADGFYFNEVCGSTSSSQITLNAISNVSSSTSININILTDLEKSRVEYLLGTGMPFDTAKRVAQADVLNIFNISLAGIQNSELLDISNSGNGNAILLAVSSILQGFRTESELSFLLSTIGNDISADGVLNNTSVMSSIIDHAILLDTISIRNNITNYYLSRGITPSISNFENYIKQFIDNSTFPVTNEVNTYPATGLNGSNFLFKSQLQYNLSDPYFSLAGQGRTCSSIKIRMHLISGSFWGINLGSNNNLNITIYDQNNNEQFFTVIDPSLPFDCRLVSFFGTAGTFLIEYFEGPSTIPTFSKTITLS